MYTHIHIYIYIYICKFVYVRIYIFMVACWHMLALFYVVLLAGQISDSYSRAMAMAMAKRWHVAMRLGMNACATCAVPVSTITLR